MFAKSKNNLSTVKSQKLGTRKRALAIRLFLLQKGEKNAAEEQLCFCPWHVEGMKRFRGGNDFKCQCFCCLEILKQCLQIVEF